MTLQRKNDQEDPLIDAEEDALEAEGLQESLENLRTLALDDPRKLNLPYHQSGGDNQVRTTI